MKKYLFLTLAFIFCACSSHQGSLRTITKGELYPKMYTAKPKSILILPAVNTTKANDASRAFSFTVAMPLASFGYYVFPVHLVDQYIKAKGLAKDGIIKLKALKQLKEQFNPDAIMFVDIDHWSSSYRVIKSSASVGVTYNMIDANTGEQIWSNSGLYYKVAGGTISTSAGLIGLVIGTAIASASALGQDQQEYASMAYLLNSYAFYDLPRGFYSKEFLKDASFKLHYYDEGILQNDRIYVKEYFVKGSELESGSSDKLCVSGAESFGACTGLKGYEGYYRQKIIGGKMYYFNSFFHYENGLPYLLSDNKKAFVKTEDNGKIPYYKETKVVKNKYGDKKQEKFYFKVKEVKDLKK